MVLPLNKMNLPDHDNPIQGILLGGVPGVPPAEVVIIGAGTFGLAAALGFLAAGSWDESSLRDIREDTIDRQIGRYLDRDDIVTTVMQTFTSTTVQCARCHDHKFDPISQRDYYGLQAVFASTDKANRAYDTDPAVAAKRRELIVARGKLHEQKVKLDPALLTAEVAAEVAEWEKGVTAAASLWQVLTPAEVKSSDGSTLTVQSDGSVLASGTRPEKDKRAIIRARRGASSRPKSPGGP